MGNEGAGIAALVLRVVAGALAGLVVAAGVAERTWLGGRSWWVVGFAVAALGAAWWPRGRRYESAWSAGWALLATIVAATALGRIPPGERLPGDDVLTGMTERILARDLPPRNVYAALVASTLVVVVGVVLALPWRNQARKLSRRAVGVGLVGGVLLGAVAVASVQRGALEVREVLDRRLEADVLLATTARGSERIDPSGGPAVPTEIAWHVLPSRQEREVVQGMVAVPGWDAVVVKSTFGDEEGRAVGSEVRALSTDDGSVSWSYRRDDGLIDGVAVDPARGRVLLLADRAAVVLDLASGSELDTRPLPRSLANAHLVGHFGGDVRDASQVIVGSWAVIEGRTVGEATLGLVEVGSAEVLATTPITSAHCDYAASTTTAEPVIVQWASEGDCGGPHLLHLDGSRFRTTDIDFTTGSRDSRDAERCRSSCEGDRIIATDDAIVVSIWTEPFGGIGDIVALSPDGRILWRASTTLDEPRATANGAFVVAVTDEHVVAFWGERWHLLSLADGTEQASATNCADGFETTTDGELIYGDCQEPDRTVAFRIEDLALVSDHEPSVGSWQFVSATDGYLVTADHGTDGIVALASRDGGDTEPP